MNSSDETDKALVDAMLGVLHSRKGFDWWWDGIGSENRAAIKRKMRAAAKRVLRDSV